MFRHNARLQKRRPSAPPVLGGEETFWEGRRGASSPPIFKSARGRGRVRARWPACLRLARRSRTRAARLRMGGEQEYARTGDSNPGCNYLVRGYSPSMHFFWGGDMPHYSPPLPFQRGRAGCPCVLASPRGRPAPGRGRVRARWPACQSPCPARGSRALAPTWLQQPRASRQSVLPIFPFLDRYISLARNIGYVTIKPMTKYCPVLMLYLAGVQQDRNSGLARN